LVQIASASAAHAVCASVAPVASAAASEVVLPSARASAPDVAAPPDPGVTPAAPPEPPDPTLAPPNPVAPPDPDVCPPAPDGLASRPASVVIAPPPVSPLVTPPTPWPPEEPPLSPELDEEPQETQTVQRSPKMKTCFVMECLVRARREQKRCLRSERLTAECRATECLESKADPYLNIEQWSIEASGAARLRRTATSTAWVACDPTQRSMLLARICPRPRASCILTR
jgi:hypothetical protein